MDMRGLKTKHLTIRLSEEQFKKLADTLVIEQRTKSSLLRDILSDYIDGNKGGIDKQNQNKNKNQKPL
jgi:predicted DNA-binding protein